MALQLTSPVFEEGGPIPVKYGYTEQNVNPPLSVNDVPDSAVSLALIMDDPDAVEPTGKVWNHWVVWNIDSTTEAIPEDWDASTAGAIEGQNDYGEQGYGGPNPPDGEHTYRFALFALETELDLPRSSQADPVRSAVADTVLDETMLTGTYAP